jgi:hypothetical protein
MLRAEGRYAGTDRKSVQSVSAVERVSSLTELEIREATESLAKWRNVLRSEHGTGLRRGQDPPLSIAGRPPRLKTRPFSSVYSPHCQLSHLPDASVSRS